MDARNYKAKDKIFENVFYNIPLWMRKELRSETKLGKIIDKNIHTYIKIEFPSRFIISYAEQKAEEVIIEHENENDFSFTPNAALPKPDRHS